MMTKDDTVKHSDSLKRMMLCDKYLSLYDECLSNKKSTKENIRRAFHNLINCEVKYGLYLTNNKTLG